MDWTWDQIAFAVLACVEHDMDQLDTLARYLAPLVGAKIKDNAPTARQTRHQAVIEDLHQRRARTDAEYERRLMEEQILSVAAMGIDVEIIGPEVKATKG